MFKRLIASIICLTFIVNSCPTVFAQRFSVSLLPAPGTMVNISPNFEPALIRGLTVHRDNPFLFDFIVDPGQSKLSGQALKEESDRMIKYFFASLTIPDKDIWVNLSPYEKDRMVPQALGETAMGRDLLAQDYMLKQLTASLIYPQKNLGKMFWDRVYAKAKEMYGTTEISVNTFNKVWIVPQKVGIYEHGQTAFIVEGHLKVMLEEDYLSLTKHNAITNLQSKNDTHKISSEIIRQIILPEIEKEVNDGKNFATLRQIFYAQALAVWFKRNLKQALLNRVYANKSTVKGIDQNDEATNEAIYQQYLKAYKKGVFNFIKDDIDPATQEALPRKYFSGGYADSALLAFVSENPSMAWIKGQAKDFDLAVSALPRRRDAAMIIPKVSSILEVKKGRYIIGNRAINTYTSRKRKRIAWETPYRPIYTDVIFRDGKIISPDRELLENQVYGPILTSRQGKEWVENRVRNFKGSMTFNRFKAAFEQDVPPGISVAFDDKSPRPDHELSDVYRSRPDILSMGRLGLINGMRARNESYEVIDTNGNYLSQERFIKENMPLFFLVTLYYPNHFVLCRVVVAGHERAEDLDPQQVIHFQEFIRELYRLEDEISSRPNNEETIEAAIEDIFTLISKYTDNQEAGEVFARIVNNALGRIFENENAVQVAKQWVRSDPEHHMLVSHWIGIYKRFIRPHIGPTFRHGESMMIWQTLQRIEDPAVELLGFAIYKDGSLTRAEDIEYLHSKGVNIDAAMILSEPDPDAYLDQFEDPLISSSFINRLTDALSHLDHPIRVGGMDYTAPYERKWEEKGHEFISGPEILQEATRMTGIIGIYLTLKNEPWDRGETFDISFASAIKGYENIKTTPFRFKTLIAKLVSDDMGEARPLGKSLSHAFVGMFLHALKKRHIDLSLELGIEREQIDSLKRLFGESNNGDGAMKSNDGKSGISRRTFLIGGATVLGAAGALAALYEGLQGKSEPPAVSDKDKELADMKAIPEVDKRVGYFLEHSLLRLLNSNGELDPRNSDELFELAYAADPIFKDKLQNVFNAAIEQGLTQEQYFKQLRAADSSLRDYLVPKKYYLHIGNSNDKQQFVFKPYSIPEVRHVTVDGEIAYIYVLQNMSNVFLERQPQAVTVDTQHTYIFSDAIAARVKDRGLPAIFYGTILDVFKNDYQEASSQKERDIIDKIREKMTNILQKTFPTGMSEKKIFELLLTKTCEHEARHQIDARKNKIIIENVAGKPRAEARAFAQEIISGGTPSYSFMLWATRYNLKMSGYNDIYDVAFREFASYMAQAAYALYPNTFPEFKNFDKKKFMGAPDFETVYLLINGFEKLNSEQASKIAHDFLNDKALITLKEDSALGGIDLSQQDAAMHVTKDANGGVKVDVDPAEIARVERYGLLEVDPVIIGWRRADIQAIFGVRLPVNIPQ